MRDFQLKEFSRFSPATNKRARENAFDSNVLRYLRDWVTSDAMLLLRYNLIEAVTRMFNMVMGGN